MGSDLMGAPGTKFTGEEEVSCTEWASVAPSLLWSQGSFYRAQNRQAQFWPREQGGSYARTSTSSEHFERHVHKK